MLSLLSDHLLNDRISSCSGLATRSPKPEPTDQLMNVTTVPVHETLAGKPQHHCLRSVRLESLLSKWLCYFSMTRKPFDSTAGNGEK